MGLLPDNTYICMKLKRISCTKYSNYSYLWIVKQMRIELQIHVPYLKKKQLLSQGKSEGPDSWNWPSNLAQMKSDPNRRFFSPYRLRIWRMTLIFCPVWPWSLTNHWTLKNNRAPHLWYFKLCASFQNHWWIQTGVTVQKHSIRVKIDNVFVLCDLEILKMTLNRARLLCHFKLCA